MLKKNGPDYIGLSFVRNAKALRALKSLLKRSGMDAGVIAKIETRAALNNLEDIVEAADGVMIARGDLGIEIPYAEVPVAQQRIINICRQHGKPVIIATQMLLSMVSSARPTRAEANDVATAVWNGTDALMLSEETSVGNFPKDAVKAMSSIIEKAENAKLNQTVSFKHQLDQSADMPQIMSRAAVFLANELKAAVIVVPTVTGRSSMIMSNTRPNVPILCLTSEAAVERKMRLLRGVFPMRISRSATSDVDILLKEAEKAARKSGFLKRGDRMIVASGVHGKPGDIFRLLEVRTIE